MDCRVLDDLNVKENDLALKLRKLCTPHGDERRSKLCESTEILFRIGKLYMEKADVTKDMEQKLNFIKAATLLHGARIRAENILQMSWKSEKILEALHKLQCLLMEKCAGSLTVSLLEISQNVQSEFESLRKAEKKFLDSIEVIKDVTSEDDAEKKRSEKIMKVKELLKSNSENYKKQMQRIATECEKILGPSPCAYAIVGLGSLARDEVTLYSDFEHVIILEEGVQNQEDYTNVLEYFRWFSIVFHVIVIGIGETILPSIGIESLNDFYSSDKSKDWFYDSFTPSGVSFDGMMPHACKLPIGRQRETERKEFIIELIKPVSGMTLYMTNDENIKNGYCLKDVLCETCLVFGSEEIFFEFERKAEEVLVLEKRDGTSASFFSEATSKNANPFVGGREQLAMAGLAVNTKVSFYRPHSVLIGYLYRYHSKSCHIVGISGFDKIIELKDFPLPKSVESLSWAFAVACEIRLKLYAAGQGNRQKHIGRDLLKYVGKSCLVHCTTTVADLSLNFIGSPRYKSYNIHQFMGTQCEAMMFLQDYAGAKDAALRVLHGIDTSAPYAETLLIRYRKLLAEICIQQCESVNEPAHLLEEAEKYLLEIENFQEFTDVCTLLMKIYRRQGRGEDIRKLAESTFANVGEKLSPFTGIKVNSAKLNVAEAALSNADFVVFCDNFVSRNDDILSNLVSGYLSANAMCKLGRKSEARHRLKQVVETCIINTRGDVPQYKLVISMNNAFSQQFQQAWFDDCVHSLKMFDKLIDSSRIYLDYAMYAPDLRSSSGVLSYLMAVMDENSSLKDYRERVKLCERAIELCQSCEMSDTLHELYRSAITLILAYSKENNFAEFNIWKLYKILKDAPRSIRDSADVRTSAVINLQQFYIVLAQSRNIKLLELLHKANFSFRVMEPLHTFLYPSVRELQDKIWEKAAEIGAEPLGKLVIYSLLDTGTMFQHRIRKLWKLLFIKKLEKCAFVKFLGHAYHALCNSDLVRFEKEMKSLFHQRSTNRDFQKAVKEYSEKKFLCAKAFWRIINSKQRDMRLRTQSVFFLFNTIVWSLCIRTGYLFYSDIHRQIISAGPPHYVKTINSSWKLYSLGHWLKYQARATRIYA